MNAAVQINEAVAVVNYGVENYIGNGVQNWSQPSPYDSYVIFCVGNDKYREAAFRAWAAEHGIGYKSMIGAYNGITECSFIINQKQALNCMHWWANEDSILILGPMYRVNPATGLKAMHGNREATLHYLKGDRYVEIGHMSEVSKEYALAQDAWTFDPATGKYWVAE